MELTTRSWDVSMPRRAKEPALQLPHIEQYISSVKGMRIFWDSVASGARKSMQLDYLRLHHQSLRADFSNWIPHWIGLQMQRSSQPAHGFASETAGPAQPSHLRATNKFYQASGYFQWIMQIVRDSTK